MVENKENLSTIFQDLLSKIELLVYKFNDMRDWSMFNRGTFVPNNAPFKLKNKLKDVEMTLSAIATKN